MMRSRTPVGRLVVAALAWSVALVGVVVVVPVSAAHAEPLALPNASFEEATADGKPVDWYIDPAPRAQTATVTTEQAHSGERSLEIDDPADNSVLVRSTKIAARPGELYTATGWVRGERGSPAWLYLEFWNSSGGRISETHVKPEAAADWSQVSVQATAPAGTAQLSVTVYGSGSTSGLSHYDDITVDGPAPRPYDPRVGTRTQLFVDGYRIASTDKVTRVVHEATKTGPVLSPDKPWESNNAYVYGSAIYDEAENLFKLWYHVFDRSTSQYLTCYATSRDGIHWNKPELGIFEYKGSKANNIVGTMHSPTVVKDPRDPDPKRRYKMFGMVYGSGYSVWFSPDGAHWTPSEKNPVLPDGDVANMTYDPATERFIVTSKHPHPSGRAVFLSSSEDFENWTEPRLILTADERDQQRAVANGYLNAQIYGMPIAPYKGVYIGFPWVFQYGGPGDPGTAGDGPIDTQIAFSRDLESWNRDDRTTVIPRGTKGSFDSGMIFTAGNVIVRNGKVLLYYGGWDGLHGSSTRGAAIGVATWRLDGFVSMANGGAQPGTVTTKPLLFDGDELHVNADFGGQGNSLVVEVLDADGQVIPGFGADDSVAINGDRLDATVRWRGGAKLSSLAGERIQLRFHLDGGHLYSYRFTN